MTPTLERLYSSIQIVIPLRLNVNMPAPEREVDGNPFSACGVLRGKRTKETAVNRIQNRTLFRRVLSVVLGTGLVLSLALAQDKPIRIGGNVQQANRLSWVDPVYPAEAKQNRIQGMVKLEITIDKEGHVLAVAVISGPAELIQSATDAVQQWVYRPTLLNGEPVSVITTVDVNYTLSQ